MLSLDEKIAALLQEVDTSSRTMLQTALKTLRDADNVPGAIVTVSRLFEGGSGLLGLIAAQHKQKLKGYALNEQIEWLTDQGFVPDKIASDLHTIRVYSNKARHNDEKSELNTADAEMVLNRTLSILEWFYRERKHAHHLSTIYGVTPEMKRERLLTVVIATITVIASMSQFLVDVFPGRNSFIISILTYGVTAGLLSYGTISGKNRGSILAPNQKKFCSVSLSIATVFFLVLCVRAASALSVKAVPGSVVHGEVLPFMQDTVHFDDGLSYGMHGEIASQTPQLRFNYYLISDYDFFRALFEKKGLYGGTPQSAQDIIPLSGEETTKGQSPAKELILQLLGSKHPVVMNDDTLRFTQYLWINFLKLRQPIGNLNMPFTALNARDKFDSRLFKGKDYDDPWSAKTIWVKADNSTLSKDGWLNLDPLTKKIVLANPQFTLPLAKVGFLQFTGDMIPCGDTDEKRHQYAFLVPRRLKILLLDIENIGATAINHVTFQTRSYQPNDNSLWRIRSGLTQSNGTPLKASQYERMPFESLRPNEHYVVPVAIALGEYDDQEDFEEKLSSVVGYIGPEKSVDEVSYESGDTHNVTVRKFDKNQTTYISVGYEGGGSCPFIYTWDPISDQWKSEGNVLAHAIAPSLARKETMSLQRFNGHLQIREKERETTYLDMAIIRAKNKNGALVTLYPQLPVLTAQDSKHSKIEQGQQVNLDFPKWRDDYSEPKLVVYGHYLLHTQPKTLKKEG